MLPSSRKFAFRLLALGLSLGGHPVFSASPIEKVEKLVPARFAPATDSRGNLWDLNPNGEVADGTSDCFDNAATLRIDSSQISFPRPMMTPDGKEFVYSGSYRALRVTRRVRLDAEKAALRYLEIFENPGTARQKIQVTIQTQLGNTALQVLDFKEKAFGGALDKEDGGFVAVGQSGRPSVIFLVSAPNAKEKPLVRINSNQSFQVTYSLDVPPKGSVAILHYLAQRNGGNGNSGLELLGALAKRGRLVDPNLPKSVTKLIANFTVGKAGDEEAGKNLPLLAPLQEVLEIAGLVRGKLDGVLLDAGSKLEGKISGADFEMETVFGKTPVAFAEVAAMAGGAGVHRPMRVYLRNGEILCGTALGAKVSMAAESGLNLDLDCEQFHLLTVRPEVADGVAPADAALLVTTQDGNRLAIGAAGASPLNVASPWGPVQVGVAEIRSLTYQREPFPAYQLTLADRSRFTVMLRAQEWLAPSTRFGALKLVPQSIREIRSLTLKTPEPSSESEPDSEPKPSSPLCELLAENQVAGIIDLPTVHLATETSVTAVESKQIVQLEIAAGENGERTAVIQLAGGQELKGRLTEAVLPIRSQARLWRIPVSHFLSIRVPVAEPAEPPEAERESIPNPNPPASF